jgi:hypothetical protein
MQVKILVISDVDVVSFYRAHGRMLAEGHQVLVPRVEGQIDWFDIMRADAILIPRACTVEQAQACRLVKACGKHLILDYDDALFALPLSNPVFLEYARTHDNVHICVSYADEIHFSTTGCRTNFDYPKGLIKKNRAAFVTGKETWNSASTLAAWRGSSTHIRDVDAYVKDIVAHAKTNGITNFRFFGVIHDELAKQLEIAGIAIDASPPQSLHIYMEDLKESAPKFLYIPLVKSTFNDAKSDISALEGIAAGALPVVFGEPAEFSWVTGDFSECLAYAVDRR